jgi:hypothetical protein
MKIFFLRLFFIFFLVFFEFSFFDVLFPWIAVPAVLVVSIVAWALIVDFPYVLYMVVPLTAFYDIVSSGALGTLVLYAVLLAYATSFLSRRLLVEHHGVGMVLYALFASLGSFGYMVFNFILSQDIASFWQPATTPQFFLTAGFFDFFLQIFLSVLLFPVAHRIIRSFETYVRLVAQREILQIR